MLGTKLNYIHNDKINTSWFSDISHPFLKIDTLQCLVLTIVISCQLDLCIFDIWQFTFSLMICILYSFLMQYFKGRESLKLNPEKIKHILYIYEFMLFYILYLHILYVHLLTVSPESLPWYLTKLGKSPLFRRSM